MKYPHRTRVSDDGSIDWFCRCGAFPHIYSAEVARDGWGDCPAAMLDRIAELEALQVSIHKAVAAALEARAKEIDEEAGPHRMMTAEAQSFRDGLLAAADIVRGKL